MSQKHHPLLYGDVISLECVELNRHFVTCEGFVDASVACQPHQLFKEDQDFTNTLFQVVTSSTYSSQSKITTQLAKISKLSGDLVTEQSALLQLQPAIAKIEELRENLELELKNNMETYQRQLGRPVRYGQEFQLLHVNTRKFLTLIPHEAALEERDNMRIALETFGSKYSHFIFAPIFELEQTRQAFLYTNDAVFLLSAQHLNLRKAAFIHAATQTYELQHSSSPKKRNIEEDEKASGVEVNGTFDNKTRWKIRLFSKYVSGGDDQHLNYCDIVWLRHPDLQIALSAEVSGAASESFMSLDYDDLDFGIAFKNFGETLHSSAVNSLLKSHQQGNETRDEDDYESTSSFDTNGMWRIERAEFERGGRVRFGDDIRLKHLSSGFYLCIYTGDEGSEPGIARQVKRETIDVRIREESDDSKSDDDLGLRLGQMVEAQDTKLYENNEQLQRIKTMAQEQRAQFRLTKEKSDSSIFRFQRVQSGTGSYVTKDSFIKLKHVKTSTWLAQRSKDDPHHDISAFVSETQEIREENDSPYNTLEILICSTSSYDNASLVRIMRAPESQTSETLFLLSCYAVLQNAPGIVQIVLQHEKANPFGPSPTQGFYSGHQQPRKKRATSIFRLQSFKRKIARYKLEQKKQKKQKQLVRQCLGDLISFLSLVSLKDSSARQHRQKMLREQRFIEALVELLTACFPSAAHFELLERLKKLQKLENQEEAGRDTTSDLNQNIQAPDTPTGSSASQPKQMNSRLTQIFVFGSHENLRSTKRNFELCQMVYQLLRKICEKNHINQIYAFQYLEIFVRQAPHFDEALLLLQQLFLDNETLVEAVTRTTRDLKAMNTLSQMGIRRSEVVNLPRQSVITATSMRFNDLSQVDARICIFELVERFKGTRNPIFLDLLVSLCVCNQQGVTANQELFHDVFFRKLTPQEFDQIFISLTFIDRQQLLIKINPDLVPAALKRQLDADQDSESKQQSGKQEKAGSDQQSDLGSLPSVQDPMAIRMKYVSDMVSTINPFEQFHLSYLSKQIQLFAALCHGRNYNCIEAVRPAFPIAALMKTLFAFGENSIPIAIRASLCQILTVLYIDREPLAPFELPRLCRVLDASILYQAYTLQRVRPQTAKKKKNMLLSKKELYESLLPSSVSSRDGSDQDFNRKKHFFGDIMVRQVEYKKAEAQLDQILESERHQQEGGSDEEDDAGTETSFTKPKLKHKNTLILNLNQTKFENSFMGDPFKIEEQDQESPSERVSIIGKLKQEIISYLELETHKIRRSKDDPLFNAFTLEVLKLTKKLILFGLIRAGQVQLEKLVSYLFVYLESVPMTSQDLGTLQHNPTSIIEQKFRGAGGAQIFGQSRSSTVQKKPSKLFHSTSGIKASMRSQFRKIRDGQKGLTLGQMRIDHRDSVNGSDPLTKQADHLLEQVESITRHTLLRFSPDQKLQNLIKLEICSILNMILDIRRDLLLDRAQAFFAELMLDFSNSHSSSSGHSNKHVHSLHSSLAFRLTAQGIGTGSSSSLIDYFINELRHRDLSSFLPEVMRTGDWDIDQPILNRTKQLQQKEGKNNFMFNAVVPSQGTPLQSPRFRKGKTRGITEEFVQQISLAFAPSGDPEGPLNFDSILGRPALPILLRAFNKTENIHLQSSFMKLIWACYSQREWVFRNLNQLRLICDDTEIDQFRKLQRLALSLRSQVQSSELWLGSDDESAQERAKEMLNSLNQIHEILCGTGAKKPIVAPTIMVTSAKNFDSEDTNNNISFIEQLSGFEATNEEVHFLNNLMPRRKQELMKHLRIDRMLVQFLKDANFRLPSLFSILFEHLQEKKERERKEKEFIEQTLQEVLNSPRQERKEDFTDTLKVPDSTSFLKPPDGAAGSTSLLMPPEGASGGESISLLKIETPNRRMQPRGKNVSQGKGHQGRQAKINQGTRRQSQSNQREPKGFLNRMVNAMQQNRSGGSNLVRQELDASMKKKKLLSVAAVKCILEVFVRAMKLLRAFVRDNLEHKKTLAKELSLLSQQLRYDLGQIDLICQLFTDNYKLCTQVSPAFLGNFVKLIEVNGRQAKYLQIFQVIQLYKGRTLPEAQGAVLQALLDSPRQQILLYMQRPRQGLSLNAPTPPYNVFVFEDDINGNLSSSAVYAAERKRTNPLYKDEPFKYHAKLLHILKLCASGGKRKLVAFEAKCQKVISMPYIVRVLRGQEVALNHPRGRDVKLALMDFFFHVYICADKGSDQLFANTELMEFIHDEARKLKNYEPSLMSVQRQNEYQEYLLNYLVPIIEGLYLLNERLAEDSELNREDLNTLFQFVQALEVQIDSLDHYRLKDLRLHTPVLLHQRFALLFQMESLEKKAKVLTRGATGAGGLNRDLRDMQEIISDSDTNSDTSSSEESEVSSKDEDIPGREAQIRKSLLAASQDDIHSDTNSIHSLKKMKRSPSTNKNLQQRLSFLSGGMSQHLKLKKAATGQFNRVSGNNDFSRHMKSLELDDYKNSEQGTELVSMSTINFNRMITSQQGNNNQTVPTLPDNMGDEYATLMQSAKTRSEYWGIFANIIRQSADFQNKIVNEELNVLLNALQHIEYLGMRFEDLIRKLLNFLEQGLQEENVNKQTINAVTQILWRILESDNLVGQNSIYSNKKTVTDVHGSGSIALFSTKNPYKESKHIKQRQKQRIKTSHLQRVFNRLHAPKIVLSLLCREEVQRSHSVFLALFQLMNALLAGGNKQVQQAINEELRSSRSHCETFMRKLHRTLKEEADANSHMDSLVHVWEIQTGRDKKRAAEVKEILIFIHFATENHNRALQDLMREQPHSKVSYNLVQCVVTLLESLFQHKVRSNYEKLILCFDTLIELVQGPCQPNQLAILHSSFLELSNEILSIHKDIVTGVMVNAYDSYQDDRKSVHVVSEDNFQKSSRRMGYKQRASDFTYDRNKVEDAQGMQVLQGWQFSRIKAKCAVCLKSLLQGNKNNAAVELVMKSLSKDALMDSIIEIYEHYHFIYGKVYTDDCFNHEFASVQNKNPVWLETIIETGFNIVAILEVFTESIFADDESNHFYAELRSLFLHFDNLTQVERDAVSRLSSSAQKKHRQRLIRQLKMQNKYEKLGAQESNERLQGSLMMHEANDMDQRQRQQFEAAIEWRRRFQNALLFFRINSAKVEVMLNDRVEVVYFPKPPHCHYLSRQMRLNFVKRLDRSTTRTKVASLVQNSPSLILQMKHQERMALLFKRTCLLNIIYRHLDLVKDLVFILAILLNVFVMMSYTIYDGNSMYQPKLFYHFNTYSEAQLKRQQKKRRIQQKVQLSLENSSAQKQKQLGGLERDQPASVMKKESMSRQFWLALITFTVMFKQAFIFYYLVLVLSAVLGTFVHPFIYIFMLFEILVRFSLLRGVINAVWRPKKQILLAFLLYYLIQYGYALLGFFAFQVSYQNQCDTVLNCWITTLDLAYKQDGGIGGWLLSEYNEPLGGRIYYWRFLFDTTFDLLINIIMINILAGIIIDTFAVLRDEHQRSKDELRNTCLVCGVSRSELDKNSFFKGFEYHMRQEHNVYSYVFYISYLRSKDATEYSGIETYVSERLDEGDISWFPLDFDRCQELKERDANQTTEMEQDEDQNEMKLPMADGSESSEEREAKSLEIEDLKGEVAQLKQAVQQLTKALNKEKK